MTIYVTDVFGFGDIIGLLVFLLVLVVVWRWLNYNLRTRYAKDNAYLDAYFATCARKGIDPVRGAKVYASMKEAERDKHVTKDFDDAMDAYVVDHLKKGGSK